MLDEAIILINKQIEKKGNNKMIKEDCFAYKNENGCEFCNALKVLDCNTCEFYRDEKEINVDKIEKDIANYSC